MATTVPTLQQMLADAQLALHRLQIGQLAVRVSVNGYMTEFTPAQVDKLQAYVNDLEARIAGNRTVGAVGFVF
jgi:hypothetical protein